MSADEWAKIMAYQNQIGKVQGQPSPILQSCSLVLEYSLTVYTISLCSPVVQSHCTVPLYSPRRLSHGSILLSKVSPVPLYNPRMQYHSPEASPILWSCPIAHRFLVHSQKETFLASPSQSFSCLKTAAIDHLNGKNRLEYAASSAQKLSIICAFCAICLFLQGSRVQWVKK